MRGLRCCHRGLKLEREETVYRLRNRCAVEGAPHERVRHEEGAAGGAGARRFDALA